MAKQKSEAAPQAEATTSESLLDQVISATGPYTKPDDATDMIRTLVDEVNSGTVKFDKGVDRTLRASITAIDRVISEQLSEVLHHPDFQKLEGSWRGLEYLVKNSETGTQLKIRMLNCSKRELFKDMDRAVEFDQSAMFKSIYENEFGQPGGEPYGAIIGDYEFTNHPEDIDLLNKVAGVSNAAFAPFLTAPSSQLFGMESWEELSKPRDLSRIFESKDYIKWNAFRESDDSRFVTMCMPRTLARLPYGSATKPVDEFDYEEVDLGPDGEPIEVPHDQYCWMNTAYVMGARLTDAFAQTGWCTAIRGAENGGRVSDLDMHVFKSDDGDLGVKCPTEIAITDRREKELSDLGFLPLSHYKDKDYSVFFGAQSTQKPKKYSDDDATGNAKISARLPYLMAVSRISHYLKVIARDKVGSFMEASDCEAWLNRWIMDYVLADDSPDPRQKARYPLAQARIDVSEIPGEPGSYNAVALLRPWLQMEELNASMRLVTKLPAKE